MTFTVYTMDTVLARRQLFATDTTLQHSFTPKHAAPHGVPGAVGQVLPSVRPRERQIGCQNGIHAVASRRRPWTGYGRRLAP